MQRALARHNPSDQCPLPPPTPAADSPTSGGLPEAVGEVLILSSAPPPAAATAAALARFGCAFSAGSLSP